MQGNPGFKLQQEGEERWGVSGKTDGDGEAAYGEEGARMELVADRLLRRQLPGRQKPLVTRRGCQSSRISFV